MTNKPDAPSIAALLRALEGSASTQPTNAASLGSLLSPFVPRATEKAWPVLGSLGSPPASTSWNSLAGLGGLLNPSPPPPSPALGLLGALGVPETAPAPTPTKRRAFFSFHYADVMRVNNVRKSGEFKVSAEGSGREVEGFYDGSLWERRKLEGPEAIKNLIADGVHNTSAVCVLAGSETWERRWVRYEIARAIVDGRGLLTVHINGLRHHQLGAPQPRGPNPLAYMAVGAVQGNGLGPSKYHLFEHKNGGWYRYEDYMSSVELPRWLPAPHNRHVSPFSIAALEYDYAAQAGHQNIGRWIDAAAIQAGR